jgi:hypothetical protein
MQLRVHIPQTVVAPEGVSPSQRLRLEQTVARAIERAVAQMARAGVEIAVEREAAAEPPQPVAAPEERPAPRERIDAARLTTDGARYGTPSYDAGGALVDLPVQQAAGDRSAQQAAAGAAEPPMTLTTEAGDRIVDQELAGGTVIGLTGNSYRSAGGRPYVITPNLGRALNWGNLLFGGLGFAVLQPTRGAHMGRFYVVGLREPLTNADIQGFGQPSATEQGDELAAPKRDGRLIAPPNFRTVTVVTREGVPLMSNYKSDLWNVQSVTRTLSQLPIKQSRLDRADVQQVSQALFGARRRAGNEALLKLIVDMDRTLFAAVRWQQRAEYLELLIAAWTSEREEIAIIELIHATRSEGELEAIFAQLRAHDAYAKLFDDLDGRVYELLKLLGGFRPAGALSWAYLVDIAEELGLLPGLPLPGAGLDPLRELQRMAGGVLDWLAGTVEGIAFLLTRPGDVIQGLGHLVEFLWTIERARWGDPEAQALLTRLVQQAGASLAQAIRGLRYAEELGTPYGKRGEGAKIAGDILGRLKYALILEILTWFIGIGEVKAAIQGGEITERLAALARALGLLSRVVRGAEAAGEAARLQRLLRLLGELAGLIDEARLLHAVELLPDEHVRLLQRLAREVNLPEGATVEALQAVLRQSRNLRQSADQLSDVLAVVGRVEALAERAGGMTEAIRAGLHAMLRHGRWNRAEALRLIDQIPASQLTEFMHTMTFVPPDRFARWGAAALSDLTRHPRALGLIREGGADLLDVLHDRLGHWAEIDTFLEALARKRAEIGDPAAYQRLLERLRAREATAFFEVAGPSLLQRQRAAALRTAAADIKRTITSLHDEAADFERRAAQAERAHKTSRAARLRAQATRRRRIADQLSPQIDQLYHQADQFERGLRSATEDFPTPEELELAFEMAQPEHGVFVQVGLDEIERHPEKLERLLRPIMRSSTGNRVVFRVDGGGSRSLISIDAANNVTIERGHTIHLDFGSVERAREFLQKRGSGSRIVAFEVSEEWVRSLRSAALPERDTGLLHGQARLVDVRYAEDQMEIPAHLVEELQQFIIPGSGRVVEVNP